MSKMDNPVDHRIDLGFVNYVQHPDDPNYVVYRFTDIKRADSFEEELKLQGIWFERAEDEKRGQPIWMFGIHKKDYKKVEKINFVVEGRYKKPLIPFRFLRYFLLVFSTIVMTLALIGYCKAQEKIRSSSQNNTSINKTFQTE
jgi:hypothetical protein